jgi:hypothetical protein
MLAVVSAKFKLLGAFALAITFLAPYFWAQNAAAADTKSTLKNVTLLHQTSATFGKFELYLCPYGGRLVARNGDLIIATRAPEWTLMVYSKGRNLALVEKGDKITTTHLGIMTGGVTINRGVEYPRKDLLFGFKYSDILCKALKSDKPSVDSPIFQERVKKIYLDTTVKLAKLDNAPPKLLDFLFWIFNTGRFKGLPLECKTRCLGGAVDTAFCTLSVEKVSKPASFFDYPIGFKKTDDLMQVLMQEGFADTLEDLWGASPHKAK